MFRSIATLTLLAALVATPAAEAKPKKKCKVPGAEVTLKNKHAVLLTRTVQASNGEKYEVWGCLRARGKSVEVAHGIKSEFGTSTITRVVLRGKHVGAVFTNSSADGCTGAGALLFSLVRERKTHQWEASLPPTLGGPTTGCPSVDRFVLASRGRAALAASHDDTRSVQKMDRDGVKELDRGEGIDPTSLAISGDKVRWTNGGKQRSAQLR